MKCVVTALRHTPASQLFREGVHNTFGASLTAGQCGAGRRGVQLVFFYRDFQYNFNFNQVRHQVYSFFSPPEIARQYSFKINCFYLVFCSAREQTACRQMIHDRNCSCSLYSICRTSACFNPQQQQKMVNSSYFCRVVVSYSGQEALRA